MTHTREIVVTAVGYALSTAVCAGVILRRRKEPTAMIAWIGAVITLPFVGVLLYLLIGEPRIERKVRKRRRRRSAIEKNLARQAHELARLHAAGEHIAVDPRIVDLVQIATHVGDMPPTRGNDVALFFDADKTYHAISLAIEAARLHVHLEYYIFQPDETGRAFRDLLIGKAREGVACRVLLDGVGSWGLRDEFLGPMRDAGVEVAFFLPVGVNIVRTRLNFRNHRKLVVVDGAVAFTGSQNIGDEYRGRKKPLGPWRDTHLRVVGPAAVQLQEVFVEDWHFAAGRDLSDDNALFPPAQPVGASVVQVVASGPDRALASLHMLLIAAVSSARKSVAIMTPYFVPDSGMLLTLAATALRGVRVQLLVPSRSDSKLVLWAGRSFYEELIQAGVEIYEFDAAVLHSKTVVVDEQWGIVGSANMDIRSFKLNFELTTLLYDVGLAQALANDFAALRNAARRVTRERVCMPSWGASLAMGLARMASPLL